MGMADLNPAPPYLTVKLMFAHVGTSELSCLFCHRVGCEYEWTHRVVPGSRVTVGAHRNCLERVE
jgi:hypothetical protein